MRDLTLSGEIEWDLEYQASISDIDLKLDPEMLGVQTPNRYFDIKVDAAFVAGLVFGAQKLRRRL